MLKGLIFALLALAPAGAYAQSVKSEVTASNGVQVTVYSDDFADRKEFSSPWIDSGDGKLMVATVRKAGTSQPIVLSGFFVYSGEWRRYSSALFKGGDPAKFTSEGRNVGRCSSSRYSRPSCTLNESFSIALTAADIKKHGATGTIAVQVRADDTSTAVFEIPVAYIKAVAELANINIEAASAAQPMKAIPPAARPKG